MRRRRTALPARGPAAMPSIHGVVGLALVIYGGAAFAVIAGEREIGLAPSARAKLFLTASRPGGVQPFGAAKIS